MTQQTLQSLGIRLRYEEPEKATYLLRDAGHKEAVKLAMDTAKQLREQGIMDEILILPRDAERYDIVRCEG